MRRAQHAVAAVLVAALAPDAAAQTRVGVLARAGADPPVTAERAARAVAAEVGEGATAIVEPRFRAEAVRRERLAPFRRARQLADEGWRAYHEVEPAFAESRLVQARQRAVEVMDLQGGLALVAEISLRLGAVRLYRGRVDEARDDLWFAAKLAPDRPVTRAEFRPSVVDLFAAAAAEARPRARLAVEAPPGAQVEVDGAAVGAGAVDVELAAGRHALVVRARGYQPSARIVDVPEAGARVEVELERDELASALDAPLEVGTPEADAALRVEAAIIFGELDVYVLAAPVWRRGAPALLGQRCEGVPARCTEVVEVGFGDDTDLSRAAARLWSALRERRGARRFPPTLLEDARLTRGEPRPGTERVVRDRSWWKSGWLWAGVGTAAVTATAWVLLTRSQTVDTTIALDPCDFGGCGE